MQGIIGATIFCLAFFGLYKLLRWDPFNPERIKDWGRTEGTIAKVFAKDGGGYKYYVAFSDASGKHLGHTYHYYGKTLDVGDKVSIRYNLSGRVQGTGTDSFAIIEGLDEEEDESKIDVFLLCAIGFGIFDIYLIVQEIMKLIAN